MLKVLDLFSGIGGFSLGLEATGGFETVGFCEIEPYPRAVLAKHWPNVPIYDDVRTLQHDGPVDVICGGYPCQPFSVAGKQRGAEDDRHLWPSMFALIQRHRPAWVIGENVAGHIGMGLDEVLSDLESEDYTTRAFVIPACAVDAQHRRDRVWIVGNSHRRRLPRDNGRRAQPESGRENVAHPDSNRLQGKQRCSIDAEERQGQVKRQAGSCRSGGGYVPDTNKNGRREGRESISTSGRYGIIGNDWWATEPAVGRVAHGVPNRSHRIKALGNAVVPQVVEMIGRAILAAHYLSPNEGEEDGQSAV